MEDKKFDLFEGIELSKDEITYFDEKQEMINIIIELIKRRLALKMSQRELAKKTVIKQPMIARIERFDSIPRLNTIIKLAYALDLKIDFNKNINSNKKSSISMNYQSNNTKYAINKKIFTIS